MNDSSLTSSQEIQGDDVDDDPDCFYEQGNTFGIKTKIKYYVQAYFSIELMAFVSANTFTGYVCKVTADQSSRLVFVYFCVLLYKPLINLKAVW